MNLYQIVYKESIYTDTPNTAIINLYDETKSKASIQLLILKKGDCLIQEIKQIG